MKYDKYKDIGIDVDGVLRDFPTALCNIYNQIYKTNIKTSDITHWDLKQTFTNIKTPEVYYDLGIYLFYEAKPYEGVQSVLTELMDRGHRIHIVTNQPKGLEYLTQMWIKENNIPYDGIFFTYNKGLYRGDVLVDDGVHNLEKFYGHSICRDQPYNQEWKSTRISKLDELLTVIK